MNKLTEEMFRIMKDFRDQKWAPNIPINTIAGVFVPTVDGSGVLWMWTDNAGNCRAQLREKNFRSIDPRTFCLVVKLLRMQHPSHKNEFTKLIEALHEEFNL